MVVLNARFAALTRFDSRQLLEFAVILLNLSAKSARLLCALCGITSKVVGYDPVRAARRHHNPEKFHLVIFGKAAYLDQLAVLPFLLAPLQVRDMAIRPCSAAIVHHTVALERTIEYLAVTVTAVTAAYIQHQVFGGIPTVHQNRGKRNFALAQSPQHLRHIIEFGFSIAVRVVNAVIQHPAASSAGVNVET